MGFIEKSLGPGEQVTVRGQQHWLLLGYGAAVMAIGTGIALSGDSSLVINGWLIIAVGLYYALRAYLDHIGVEFAVTNQRVLAKYGVLRRRTVDLKHADVEGFCVQQGILGRMLNYGTVILTDPEMQTQIHRIRDPLRFRALAMQQIEATQHHRP